MVKKIDDGSAVAAFRQGRSLCLRLHGTLDTRLACAAATMLGQDRHAIRLRLECSALREVDSQAVERLADVLLAWVAVADGRTVDIHNLDVALQAGGAWRPLRSFHDPDEAVFFDPARDRPWLAGASRH